MQDSFPGGFFIYSVFLLTDFFNQTFTFIFCLEIKPADPGFESGISPTCRDMSFLVGEPAGWYDYCRLAS